MTRRYNNRRVTDGKVVKVHGKRQIATGLHYMCQNGHWVRYRRKWMIFGDYVALLRRHKIDYFANHPGMQQFERMRHVEYWGLVDCPDWIDLPVGTEFLYVVDRREETGVPLRMAGPGESYGKEWFEPEPW